MIETKQKLYATNYRKLATPNPIAAVALYQWHNELLQATKVDSPVQADAQITLMNVYDDYRKATNFNGFCALITIPEEQAVVMAEFDGVLDGEVYAVHYDEIENRHYIEI